MVCIRLKQWLRNISATCGTYVTTLVCMYDVRTRRSYLYRGISINSNVLYS
jgi:hypothetical protein